MNTQLAAIGAVVLLAGVTLAPFGASQMTLLDVSLGVVYEENFDDGTGGWTANEYEPTTRPAPDGSWAWGAPTSGPGSAHSGANAWATNLGGNYGLDECAAIASPVIDLTNASSALVSFSHWFDMEQSRWGSIYDAGTLFVTRDGGETFEPVTPVDGYSGRVFWSSTRTCFDGASSSIEGFSGASTGWETETVVLDDFTGDEVQFVFSFASRNRNVLPGWYMDDFHVTVDGTTTTESFESSDGGFTLMTTKPAPAGPIGWQHGLATAGPTTESSLWGTNLDGDHGPNECSWLESPAIVIGEDFPNEANALVKGTLSWEQWFDTAAGVAAGVVQIGHDGTYTNLVPEGGYASELRYLDPVHDACIEYETQGSGAFAGDHTSSGELTEQRADVSAWLGEEVTIRFLFVADHQNTREYGWYVDNVAIELAAYAESPVDPEEHVPQVENPTEGTDPMGWSSGGEDSTWTYGVASDGPVGETVYMTNLDGDHADKECSWAQTPAIPGALLLADSTLVVDHWRDMYLSSWSGPWGAGVLMASTDDGATWEYVDTDAYTHDVSSFSPRGCLRDTIGLDYPTRGWGGATEGFETSEVDLSAYADPTKSVTLRFVFAGGSLEEAGWALRGVTAGGVSLL